mgnify:CR=1 FL=1
MLRCVGFGLFRVSGRGSWRYYPTRWFTPIGQGEFRSNEADDGNNDQRQQPLHDETVLQGSIHFLYALDVADAVEQCVQTGRIRHVDTDLPFENAVVALDGKVADIDTLLHGDDL